MRYAKKNVDYAHPYLYYSTDLENWTQQEVTTKWEASGGSGGYYLDGDWEYAHFLLIDKDDYTTNEIPLIGLYIEQTTSNKNIIHKTVFDTSVLPTFSAKKTDSSPITCKFPDKKVQVMYGKCVCDYYNYSGSSISTWNGVAKINLNNLTYSYLFTPDKPSGISATTGSEAKVIFVYGNYALISTQFYDWNSHIYYYGTYLWNTSTDDVTKLSFMGDNEVSAIATGTLPE